MNRRDSWERARRKLILSKETCITWFQCIYSYTSANLPEEEEPDSGLDARVARASRNHAVSVLLRHAMRRSGKPSRRAPQRPFLVVRDARRSDVFVEIGSEAGDARRFVLLASFLVQAYPAAPPLNEI